LHNSKNITLHTLSTIPPLLLLALLLPSCRKLSLLLHAESSSTLIPKEGNEKLGVNQKPFSLKEIDPGPVGYEPTTLSEAFL